MRTSPGTYFVLILTFALLGAEAPAETVPPPPARHVHALLIGCTEYPELGSRYQLRGPGNDVALTAELLHDRFGFADADIVRLVHENDASRRPTFDSIVREFSALIERIGPGDNVFIMLSGHGSQLKDDNPNDPNDDEYDGLDEVFLTEDVVKWKLNGPVVKAIRDDQIRIWLDAIRAHGAFVFFVADTCHAGTMNRGAGGGDEEDFDEGEFFRERTVSAQLINSPDAFDDLPDRQPESEAKTLLSAGATDFAAAPHAQNGGLIALFAVDEKAEEKEHAMPPYNKVDGPHYGRLTFALNAVLAGSNRPLSYRELAQQIRWRYEAWVWRDYGYMLGTTEELDREVLGNGSWRDRSVISLSRDKFGQLSIDAGLLRSALAGNVYRVYPPAGAGGDEAAAGCVRVTAATPTTAQVEPCEYGVIALKSSDKLPEHGRCELAYAARDALKMTIDVAPWSSDVDEKELQSVDRRVQHLAAADGALFRLSDDGEVPDAVVLLSGDSLNLRSIFDAVDLGATDVEARFPQDFYGPFPVDGDDSTLTLALQAMAKASNLRRVATAESEEPIVPHGLAVAVELKVERLNPESGAYQPVDQMWALDVSNGDVLRVSAINRGRAPADVTILHIDSANRIVSCYPTAVQAAQKVFNNRVAPGKHVAIQFSINDDTIGPEDVLVIATAAVPKSPPVDFTFLERPGLNEPRGNDSNSALNTPTGQLFAALGFGRNTLTSGTPDPATFAVRRISWNKRERLPVNP